MSARQTLARVYAALSAAAVRFVDAEAYRLSASLSFYALSSIFPLMLVVISIGKVALGDSRSLQNSLLSALDATHSEALRSLLVDTLASLRDAHKSSVLGIVIGALGSLFGASGIFLELDAAMSKIFRIPPPKESFWRSIRRTLFERLTALLLVVGTSVLLLCGTLLLSTAELIVSKIPLVADAFPGVLTEAGTATFMVGALLLCYRVVPNVPVATRAAALGGISAGLMLMLVRWPLTFLVGHLTNYSAYGVVGTLLLLLTWFYVAGCILMFGAALTAVTNRPLSERRATT